jgi:hypothetical protein
MPPNSTLLDIGVGGVFAILLIRLVLDWAKPLITKQFGREQDDNQETGCRNCRDTILHEIGKNRLLLQDLHAWHNVRNSDGGYVWYRSPNLERALTQLSESIDKHTELVRILTEIVRDSQKTMERVERKLDNG